MQKEIKKMNKGNRKFNGNYHLCHCCPFPIWTTTVSTGTLRKTIQTNRSVTTVFALEKSFNSFDTSNRMSLSATQFGCRQGCVIALTKNSGSTRLTGTRYQSDFYLGTRHSSGFNFKSVEHFRFHAFFPLHLREIFMTLLDLQLIDQIRVARFGL